MRNLHRSDLAPASLLVVDDPGEAIQAGLMSAMIKFNHHGNKTGLTAWMQVAERLNQRETVGICQYALTLKPSTSAALLGVLLRCASFHRATKLAHLASVGRRCN